MKSILKKLICLLCSTLLLLFTSSGFAKNASSNKGTFMNRAEGLPEKIYVSIDDDGESIYSEVSKANAIKAEYTGKAEIYELNNGEYISLAEGNQIVSVGFEEFRATASTEYITQKYDVPPQFLDRIEKTKQYLLEKGYGDAIISISIPLSANSMSSATSSNWTWGSEYSYGTWRLKDCTLSVAYDSTSYKTVVSGPNTSAFMDKLFNFTVSGASMIPGPVGLFVGGVSALTAFIQLFGTVPSTGGQNGDYAQFNAHFDWAVKETYVYYGGQWQLGHISRQAKLHNIDFYQKYIGVRSGTHTSTSYNTIYRTPNYLSPGATAVSHIGTPVDEYVRISIGGYMVYLSAA